MTDDYFGKMGLRVRYFMPAGSSAPLAFYFRGDLLNDYSHLQLIGTISTMETFQKILSTRDLQRERCRRRHLSTEHWKGDDFYADTDHLRSRRSAASSQSRREDTRQEHFVNPHRGDPRTVGRRLPGARRMTGQERRSRPRCSPPPSSAACRSRRGSHSRRSCGRRGSSRATTWSRASRMRCASRSRNSAAAASTSSATANRPASTS